MKTAIGDPSLDEQANPTVARGLGIVGKLPYFVALPVLCGYLAWLRVTEAEVSHGV